MKSKFQIASILRNEAPAEGADNGGGATASDTVEFPTTLTAPTTWIALEESDGLIAEVVAVRQDVNFNGKPYFRVTFQLENGRASHDLYVTPGAVANTKRQLNRAFGIESFKEIQSIVGQKCSLRTKAEEYNGRIQVKVAFINRWNPFAGTTVDLDDLDALAAASTPAPVGLENVEF